MCWRPVQPNCTFAAHVSFRRSHGKGVVPITVKIHFLGNGYLAGAKKVDHVKVGHKVGRLAQACGADGIATVRAAARRTGLVSGRDETPPRRESPAGSSRCSRPSWPGACSRSCCC